MSILDELAAASRARVAGEKRQRSLSSLRDEAEALTAEELASGTNPYPFAQALTHPGLSFICEVKKASPSKGVIAESFPYLEIARSYEAAGADAISVLTEPRWFLGSDEYLREIADAVAIPVLRKDFTVDEYQIYQAKTLGASAVLLICSILPDTVLRDFRLLAESLGLSALVEAHDAHEIERALECGATILGVNNRNLADFSVSFENAARLRSVVPEDVCFVAESGVKTADDVAAVAAMDADAVLIGEALMRSDDVAQTLADYRAAAERSSISVPPLPPKVKFCGLSQPDDIEAVNRLAPDYVGFVFYPPSPRAVTAAEAAALRAALAPTITTVGVFVDMEPAAIAELVNAGIISVAQLHGSETDEDIATLRALAPDATLWKTFLVIGPDDIAAANASTADLVVLDADLGAGRRFEWSWIGGLERPFMLAGGLTVDNVAEAIERYHPAIVDVSSGIEATEPAADGRRHKDPKRMAAFKMAVQTCPK